MQLSQLRFEKIRSLLQTGEEAYTIGEYLSPSLCSSKGDDVATWTGNASLLTTPTPPRVFVNDKLDNTCVID